MKSWSSGVWGCSGVEAVCLWGTAQLADYNTTPGKLKLKGGGHWRGAALARASRPRDIRVTERDSPNTRLNRRLPRTTHGHALTQRSGPGFWLCGKRAIEPQCASPLPGAACSTRCLVKQRPNTNIAGSQGTRQSGSPPALSLHVEPKLHNVSILNDVLFSLDSELACFSGFRE